MPFLVMLQHQLAVLLIDLRPAIHGFDQELILLFVMPSVVADTINSALFDEIGDNILECDGKTLKIVEDYAEEVEKLLEK